MTKQELDEIRARCEAATEEPWPDNNTDSWKWLGIPRSQLGCNRHFIAHARRDVPRLLDEIEHLRDRLEEEIAYSSKLRENLREVEPYCREPALAVVEDRYTWTAERCSVCSAEFVQGYGTHKKNCPFYEGAV